VLGGEGGDIVLGSKPWPAWLQGGLQKNLVMVRMQCEGGGEAMWASQVAMTANEDDSTH
jgi:hypothetical protein